MGEVDVRAAEVLTPRHRSQFPPISEHQFPERLFHGTDAVAEAWRQDPPGRAVRHPAEQE